MFLQLFFLFLLSSPLLLQAFTLLKQANKTHTHIWIVVSHHSYYKCMIKSYIHTRKQTRFLTASTYKILQASLPSFPVLLFRLLLASLAPSSAAPAEPDVSFPIPDFLFQNSRASYPQMLLWRHI